MSDESEQSKFAPARELRDRFIQYLLLERRMSPYTGRNYAQAVDALLTYLARENWSGDFNALDLRTARGFVIESQREVSKRSLRLRISALRTFFDWMMSRKACANNVFKLVAVPKARVPLPRYLTEDLPIGSGPMESFWKRRRCFTRTTKRRATSRRCATG